MNWLHRWELRNGPAYVFCCNARDSVQLQTILSIESMDGINWSRIYIYQEWMKTSSFNWAFSIRSFCSSKYESSVTGGPPQEGQMTFLRASLIAMFSQRILSLSDLSVQLSALSCCAWKRTRNLHGIIRRQRSRKFWQDLKEKNWIERKLNLHLSPSVLEPEFDLSRMQA